MRLLLPRPLRTWALALGLASALALLQGFMVYIGVRQEGLLPAGASVGRFLAWQLLSWSAWGLLAPAILWLGTRFPPERPIRWLAVHLPAALVASLASNLTSLLASRLVRPWGFAASQGPILVELYGRAATTIHVNLVLYFAILGAGYALDYRRRFRERELSAARLETRLANARLEALRLQLQPHFLFNTLHTAAGLVRQGENAAAIDTLTRLADLLRVTLEGRGRQLVPLAEELELADLYLEIQRARFSDRLQIERQIDSTLLDVPVPAFVLQPLLENAVRHGIARRAGAGWLGLVAASDGGRVRLEVQDDGVGLEPEAGAAGAAGSEGVGLGNTRARLAQLYGGEAALELLPRERGGAVARLTLPTAPLLPAAGDEP